MNVRARVLALVAMASAGALSCDDETVVEPVDAASDLSDGSGGVGGTSSGGAGGSTKPCPPQSVVKEFELVYAQSRDCSADTDCEISPPLIAAPCFYHCPVAVAKTEAGSLTGAVASLGDLCTCENDPPECAFDVVAVCDAGTCELAKPPIDR